MNKNGSVFEHARHREKVCFGFAASAYSCEMAVANAFLLLFCTDVVGLSAESVGILILVAKLLDAGTDILITHLADKTVTRWGKYRPWILLGIPMAVSFVLLYWNPGFLQEGWQKLLWIGGFYLLTIPGFETAITCPMQVMCTSVSQYDEDRVQFVTAKSLGEASGDLICSAIVMPVVLLFGSYREIAGWRYAVLIIAAIIMVFTLIGFFGTKERVLHPNVDEAGNVLSFRKKLTALRRNTAFYKMLAITVCLNFLWIFSLSLSSYHCIYYLGREDWVSVLYMIATLVQIGFTCFVPLMCRHFGKRGVAVLGAVSTVLSGIVCSLTVDFAGAAVYASLRGIGVGLLMGAVWSLWPDCTDYTEWKSGRAVPGIVMAFANFSTKLSIGVASYAATFCLTLIHFDSSLLTQPPSMLNGIRSWLTWVPILGGIFVIILVISLREMKREPMEKIREQLYARRLSDEMAGEEK